MDPAPTPPPSPAPELKDEASLREWLTGTIGAYVQSDAATDECVAFVIDGLRALGLVRAPLVVPTLHHNIEYFQVIEDDTEGWHVTGENHAGMKITAYHPERWEVALHAVNLLAAEWTAPAGADTEGEEG